VASVAAALSIAAAITLAAYSYAAFVVRGHHLEGAWRWVRSASHGFVEHTGPYSVATALYGLCRSLLWSPSLDQTDMPRLLGQLMLGLLVLGVLTGLALRHRRALDGLPLQTLSWLAAPYVALALVFFGSDTERWIFCLPVLWLLAAVAIDATLAPRRWALLLVGYLALANFALGLWPAHYDVRAKLRAIRAAEAMTQDALVLFPGHDWDEYVSFYGDERGQHLEPFPLSYYLARDGEERMWERLDREVGAARARGHQVYGVRLFDGNDDGGGYVEMHAIGVSTAGIESELRARFNVLQMPNGVVRLDSR
jgi:hypothetical protein